MTRLVDLIKNDLWLWVINNLAEGMDPYAEIRRENFWVKENSSQTLETPQVKFDLSFFAETKEEKCFIPGVTALRITSGNRSFLVTAFEERPDKGRAEPRNDSEASIFLFRILFSVRNAVTPITKIPPRVALDWAKDGAFSADMHPYLPLVDVIELSPEELRYSTNLLSSLFACRSLTSSAHDREWLRDPMVALLIMIPDQDHDWIYSEVLMALESRHPQYTFMLLYRILEFFFPMPGINELRKDTNSSETHLSLLRKCTERLGWHWKHAQSAKSVTKMVGTKNFMNPLISAGLLSTSKSAADAGEKLVLLRNKLSHQGYKALEISDDQLKAAILSVIYFCTDAFGVYKSWQPEIGVQPPNSEAVVTTIN